MDWATRQRNRRAIFDESFRSDLRWWVQTDRKVALRVLDLVEACMRDPFVGIGKPEPLQGDFAGLWSRRVTAEHRVVYDVRHDEVIFLQARYHY